MYMRTNTEMPFLCNFGNYLDDLIRLYSVYFTNVVEKDTAAINIDFPRSAFAFTTKDRKSGRINDLS
jgi:hypothetical protein